MLFFEQFLKYIGDILYRHSASFISAYTSPSPFGYTFASNADLMAENSSTALEAFPCTHPLPSIRLDRQQAFGVTRQEMKPS